MEPVSLYHVSRRNYSLGTIVRVRDGMNEFSRRIFTEGKGWVEEALERQRPAVAPERTKAQYAFDSLGACYRFAAGEDRQEVVEPTRHGTIIWWRCNSRLNTPYT